MSDDTTCGYCGEAISDVPDTEWNLQCHWGQECEEIPAEEHAIMNKPPAINWGHNDV